MADDTYTKLFSSITASTVWGEPYATRIVWVTLLAMADRDGAVHAAVPGLARAANVTLEECEAALQAFLAPDPYSRTKDHDGRRIEEIDGGWLLLNHAKYRGIRQSTDRREYQRQWDREHRPSGHARATRSDKSPTQSDKSPPSPTQAAADAEAAAEAAFGLTGAESHTPQEGKPSRSRRAPSSPPVVITDYATVFPGVSARLLEEFKAIRKAKRAPMTETAAQRIREEADKAGIPLQIAIKTCIEKNWQGFRADWYENLETPNGAPGHARPNGNRPEQRGYVDHVNGIIAEGLAAARSRDRADADTVDAEFTQVDR